MIKFRRLCALPTYHSGKSLRPVYTIALILFNNQKNKFLPFSESSVAHRTLAEDGFLSFCVKDAKCTEVMATDRYDRVYAPITAKQNQNN